MNSKIRSNESKVSRRDSRDSRMESMIDPKSKATYNKTSDGRTG